MTDTSAARVKAQADHMDDMDYLATAELLRALADERDAARALLKECANYILAGIPPGKYARHSMDIVRRARAALEAKP